MNFLNHIKTTILFLLTVLLGTQTTHAKTEFILCSLNNTLKFTNWVEGSVSVNGTNYKFMDLGISSNGGFAKFDDLRQAANSGDEVLGKFENLRYLDEATNQVKKGSFKICKSSDDVVYLANAGARSIDDLYNQFSHFIGNKGLKHIFRGEINGIGKAVGVHHISAIRSGTARIVSGTIEQLGNGFYKATVEVLDDAGNWVRKIDKSTFFPDNWDEIKVMTEIESALNNRVGVFIENTTSYQKYYGLSVNGYRIYIVRTPTYNNNVFTAWYEP